MYCDRSVAHDRRQGACSPINARRTGKSSRPSSRSDFRNSRHVELVRAAAHNGLVGGLSHRGPTRHTPTLNEISCCRPDTRDDARAHRSAFESLRGEGPLRRSLGPCCPWHPRTVFRSAGKARPKTRFCKPTADRPHSALMFAARITLPHFSFSSASSLPKSAGEPGSTVPPKSANRAFILGSARAALISALSLSTICAGVFLGAPMPYQPLAS